MEMNLLVIVIIGFLLMEATNVAALYFFPDSKLANSVGVFKAYEKSKADPEVHNLVKYLVNWVAGTKLIFIALLVVILLSADEQTLLLTGIALVLSIAVFFWRLFPLVRKMDRENQLDPKKYSSVLGWMIFGMIIVLSVAVILLAFS
jgi:hypothetical protein